MGKDLCCDKTMMGMLTVCTWRQNLMSVTNVALALLTSDTWLITRKDALEIFRLMRDGRTWAEAVFWLGVLLFVHGVLFLGDVSFGSLYTWLLMVVLNVGGPHSLVTFGKKIFYTLKIMSCEFLFPSWWCWSISTCLWWCWAHHQVTSVLLQLWHSV